MYLVNTDSQSWTMADIWSEKDAPVDLIGPIKFLSDLTVGPTYFAFSLPAWKYTDK